MSCILYSRASYEHLMTESTLALAVLNRFSDSPVLADQFFVDWSDWLFTLNAAAYCERYRGTETSEIEEAAVDAKIDYEFKEIADYNDPKEIAALFSRIQYQCSEFSEYHPKRASVELLNKMREAIAAEMLAPAYTAAVKARAEAAAARVSEDVARITAELRAKYPAAKPASAFKTSAARAAANLRAELKTAFPGVKFTVKSSTYSGGNSVYVKWTDGPSDGDVEAIAKKYAAGDFDGMDDCYHCDNSAFSQAFEVVCGHVRYVKCDRDFTLDSMQAAVDIVAARFSEEPPEVKVSSYSGSAHLEYDWKNETRHREIYQLLRATDFRL